MPQPKTDTGNEPRQRFSFLQAVRHGDPRRRKLVMLVGRGVLLALAAAALIAFILALIGDVPRAADGHIDFAALMGRAKDTVWAPFIVMAIFILLNFAGMPQFLLVGGTVVVFGAWLGFLYGWAATMVSSSVGFWLGHFFGGELLRRFAGARANEFSQKLGKHGILASAIVRVVPAGPALGVNMAAGVSHIGYGKFLIGTAIGVAPKVFVIAMVGDGILSFFKGGNMLLLAMVAALVVLWVAFMVFVKRYFNRWRETHAPEIALDKDAPNP
jgi:uncharacterized membrane protein YdjX (TVP38/TMEM64 family)